MLVLVLVEEVVALLCARVSSRHMCRITVCVPAASNSVSVL